MSHPRASKRLIAKVFAFLRRRGSATDLYMAQRLGCNIGHIYDIREREPRITCNGNTSSGYDKVSKRMTVGGDCIVLATHDDLKRRAKLIREIIAKDQATLALVRKALKRVSR